jgi:hypothetical protein
VAWRGVARGGGVAWRCERGSLELNGSPTRQAFPPPHPASHVLADARAGAPTLARRARSIASRASRAMLGLRAASLFLLH